jgi:prepilin-type N-terminal cleavage/methylation domain-containing protein
LKHLYQIFKALKKSKGFTLLESMMVMAMLSIVMVIIFYAFSASMSIFSGEISEADASLEAHRTMERMTKDLRGALQIVAADSTSISFWSSDINGDGTVEANEVVTYSWTGTSEGYINRTVQTSTREISTGIKSFALTYNDPSLEAVRVITINITAQKGANVSTIESSVDGRNL